MQESPAADRVAGEIRAQLARRQLSQGWLCKQIGMSGPTLSKRMNGRRAFDLSELERIAAALEVDLSSLIGAAA